jgi:hypothetical protein
VRCLTPPSHRSQIRSPRQTRLRLARVLCLSRRGGARFSRRACCRSTDGTQRPIPARPPTNPPPTRAPELPGMMSTLRMPTLKNPPRTSTYQRGPSADGLARNIQRTSSHHSCRGLRPYARGFKVVFGSGKRRYGFGACSPCYTMTSELIGVRDCCFEHEWHPLQFSFLPGPSPR